ncbi:MAG: AsmA family protein [Deltaproteobacteria bacterium]|nr:AsmA family protein [Deltaproteobacteria bacterium]
MDYGTVEPLPSPLSCRAGGALAKKALAIGASVLGLLIAAVLIVPAFVDLGRFKSTYLPWVEETLHRRLDVGEVRLTLLPTPSIKLSNLKVSDGPVLSADNVFAAREVRLRLKFWPLLRGRFEMTEFVLEKPVFNLRKHSNETFKDSDQGRKKAPTANRRERTKRPAGAKTQDAVIPLVLPGRMRVNDGQLNIITAGRKPLRIDGIGLSMQEFSSEKPFPYRASFDYPGLKTVSLEGQLDYREEQATLTLKDNRLKIQNLALRMEGSVSNLSTTPRIDLILADDNLDAKPILQILAVFGLAPRDIEISGPMALRIAMTGPSNSLMTQIHGRFKDVKVHGKRAIKGNLSGGVFLRLPLGGGSDITRQLQGDGKLSARDGELTNVDLIKKVQRVTGVIGFSQDERRQVTKFKTLETEFTLGNGLVDFKQIHLLNPQMELNGGGTMTLGQAALNIGIDATLSAQASTRASRGKTTEFFKNNRGRLVVPLKITGRVENPVVNIDSEKMAQRGVSQALQKSLASFFKQLFRR